MKKKMKKNRKININKQNNTIKTITKRRKVIRLGQALVITLPKEFCVRAGLTGGEIVGVTYDSVLVIVNPNLPKEKEQQEEQPEEK